MDQPSKTNHVFLHPGEYVLATSACTVHTLLGSCVSLVLWHPARKIGAMTHAIIPTRGNKAQTSMSGRYVDESLSLMLRDLERLGIDPRGCRVNLYGGSNMLQLQMKPEVPSIGRQNGELAKRLLAEQGITLTTESLFGNGYRKLEFDVESGEVVVRQGESEIEFEQSGAGRVALNAA